MKDLYSSVGCSVSFVIVIGRPTCKIYYTNTKSFISSRAYITITLALMSFLPTLLGLAPCGPTELILISRTIEGGYKVHFSIFKE